jgi:phosphate transport system permease protein
MSATATTSASIPGYATGTTHLSRRKLVNRLMLGLTGLMTIFALVPLFWIIGYVIYRGASNLNLAFFTQMPTPLGVEGGGVLHAIEGTVVLTLLAGLFAIPPGLLAAIYAAQKPNTPLGIALRFGTDVLSGVPSIVVGLFGYTLIVKQQGHYSALAGGVALSILMLPIIIRTTEEMLKLIPSNLREAALGLGAPEWRTSLNILLPAALNGIITGVVLGLARASGETAPLLFTALGNERYNLVQMIRAGAANGLNPFQIFINVIEQPTDSLPLTLFKYSQMPYPERVDQAWTVALVLMILVLLVNILTRLWVQNRASRLKG